MQFKNLQHDDLDDMFIQKDSKMRVSISPKKMNRGKLGPIGQSIYKGKESKFLRSLEECLSYEAPQNTVLDQLANMIKIGQQPEVTQLKDLKTIDQHLEWKIQQNNAKKLDLLRKQKEREMEEIQHKNHIAWKKEQEQLNLQKKQAQDRMKCQTFITNSQNEQKHRRLITIDYGSESLSGQIKGMERMRQSQKINFYSSKPSQNQSPSKNSEASDSTATTSNYRFAHAPSASPNKLRRNIKQIANETVQYLNFTTPVSPVSRPAPPKTIINMSTNFQSISPVKKRGQMPGKSLFSFNLKTNQTSNDQSQNLSNKISRARLSTAASHSPSKKNKQIYKLKLESKQEEESTQVSSLFSNSILSSLPIIKFNGKSQCLSQTTLTESE